MIDKIRINDIIRRIVNTVGDNYVYISIDIDVLDPGKYYTLNLDYPKQLILTEKSLHTCDRNH